LHCTSYADKAVFEVHVLPFQGAHLSNSQTEGQPHVYTYIFPNKICSKVVYEHILVFRAERHDPMTLYFLLEMEFHLWVSVKTDLCAIAENHSQDIDHSLDIVFAKSTFKGIQYYQLRIFFCQGFLVSKIRQQIPVQNKTISCCSRLPYILSFIQRLETVLKFIFICIGSWLNILNCQN